MAMVMGVVVIFMFMPCSVMVAGFVLMSFLTYNYVRELGKVISNCVHGVKYAVMGKNGVIELKSQSGFLYTYDVLLMESSEEDMKVIMEQVNVCVIWLEGE